MGKKMKKITLLTATLFIIFNLSSSFAVELAMKTFRQEEELLILGEQFVVTPTKTKKKVRRTPAIVTVITAEEIKNMGARNLADILRTVPGIGIQISQGYARSEIEVRGVGTRNSEKVLVLIDGHKMNTAFFGGATTITTDMAVDNIKRIEIVRGPGSAIYGDNAFMAVVNIITKRAEDVDGVQVKGAVGSYDTYRYNLLFGRHSTDKLKASGSVDYFNSDGADFLVEEDALYVKPLQPGISMAPGRTDKWIERYQLDLLVSYADLYFRGSFIDLEHGPFVGVRNALSDETKMEFKQFFTELGIEHSFGKDTNVLARVYYDHFDFDLFFELFPEGYMFQTYEYPDGLLTNVAAKNRTLGSNLQWDYRLFEDNLLTLGLVYEYIEQFDVRTYANFDTNTPGAPLDDPPFFKDVTDDLPFNREEDREILALYTQDDWEINEYLSLILGVRYDHYSDFGEEFSPRAGLTVHPLENLDIKLLYGHAFRAPSFEELYNQNNVAVVGNPDLDAESLDTYEVGLGYRLNNHYSAGVNYFHTEIDDLIVLGPTISGTIARQFENIGEVEIDGMEFEFKAQYTKDNYGHLNFSIQDAEDKKTGNDLADVPTVRGNATINFALTKYLNVNTHVFYSGKRPRAEGDSRDDLPEYTLVDLSLILKEFLGTMEIKASVYNLFDEEYVDPALPTLPNDEPQPGINYMVEVSYTF